MISAKSRGKGMKDLGALTVAVVGNLACQHVRLKTKQIYDLMCNCIASVEISWCGVQGCLIVPADL